MSEKISSETVPQIPEITLLEGRDFLDEDELLEIVVQNVQELGVSEPNTVLLCGYDGNKESEHEGGRTTTFAYSIAETRGEIESYSKEHPFEYAWQQGDGGGIPTVAAFDPRFFTPTEVPNEYRLSEGSTLKHATLLKVRLEV